MKVSSKCCHASIVRYDYYSGYGLYDYNRYIVDHMEKVV